MQILSALSVRSHQRRQFISSTFEYRNDNVLKRTGARTFEFLELEVGAKPLHALTFSIHPALFVHSPAYAVSRARTVHQFNNGPRRPVQWGGAGAPKLL